MYLKWQLGPEITKIADSNVWRKILTGENIDVFDEFPTIRQYFPYQNFTFSHLPIMNLWRSGLK